MMRANADFSVSNLEASGTILPQSNKLEVVSKMEEEPLVGNSTKVELQSQIEDEDAEKILEMNPIMTPLLKLGSSYDQEVLASVSKKKITSFFLQIAKEQWSLQSCFYTYQREITVTLLLPKVAASTSMRMTIICGLSLFWFNRIFRGLWIR
ncbi:hypothetical protein PIB30_015347 [Stylosanthes scabra]|uniref:Uncharacterized protein n=1 Tax=Stylosanthes scabra TaxID=79078 RepID=A0ABU6R796_9FABA|nr:hypothetical protein [Stylosanthes scabra]